MIILINGLPGSGKSSLSKKLCERINAIYLNADEIRMTISRDLGYSEIDRIENARRLGSIASILSKQNLIVVCDFVNPNKKTREAFGNYDFLVWVDRIKKSIFSDTNEIWEPFEKYDVRIIDGMTIEQEVSLVIDKLKLFDWRKPSTLMMGRFQPWHMGHKALYEKGLEYGYQVCIGVRDSFNTSPKDIFNFEQVKSFIKNDLSNPFIVKLPNIVNVVYGRDVGYSINKINLPKEIEEISATKIREQLFNEQKNSF